MITIEQCQCGYSNCRDYWLVGAGKFCQGSGFEKEESQRIADLLNADTPASPEDAAAVEELRKQVAPVIVGAKRVPVRVAALRRLLALYDRRRCA